VTPGMPDPYRRVEAAMAAQVANPNLNDGFADAACVAVLDVFQDFTREHPEHAAAYQAPAEHLGYC
jgi:hypothetical protein